MFRVEKGRTDLAVETVGGLTEAEGVFRQEGLEDQIPVTAVEVRTQGAAKRLGKPVGRYVTVDLGPVKRREDAAFRRSAQVLAGQLSKLVPTEGTVLVVGLGNRRMTPDRLGPLCCDHLLVTNHLVEQLPGQFGAFRGVAALTPGVLGSTGVESAAVTAAVVEALEPSCVIAVDALAAQELDRLCATVQLSDTGIAPGSGVGNCRQALSRETLGVPVIALGVPTVVEGATLCADLLAAAGVRAPEELPGGELLVTPKDIDQRVEDMARLLGRAVSLALQPGLSPEELEELVS